MNTQELAKELREKLNNGVVAFSYEKFNGELRSARGTRNPEGIEYVGGTTPKGTGTERTGTISYWDLDVEGWRCCKEDKILEIYGSCSVEEYKQFKTIQESRNDVSDQTNK